MAAQLVISFTSSGGATSTISMSLTGRFFRMYRTRLMSSLDVMPPDTFTLYSNNKAKSPLAEEVFAYWRYGQSAYIPSVAEMRILHTSLPIVNPLLKRCGGDTISVMPGHCWYWTSTEVSGQASAKAWLYSLGTGAMQETPKIETHPARAIITLFK